MGDAVVHTGGGPAADDFGVRKANGRNVKGRAVARYTDFGGDGGEILKGQDELWTAVGVAAVVNCVDADKDVLGADDLGSGRIEANVVSAPGTTHRPSAEELAHLIRSIGKTPVQRDTLYRPVKIWA